MSFNWWVNLTLYSVDDGDSTIHVNPCYISPLPPKNPYPGDLWFDSEHLEMRVWYITADSFGGWVSSTHPGMRPSLAKTPNPDPLSLTGPAIAQEFTESGRFIATISWKILESGQTPKIKWETSDPLAQRLDKTEDGTIVTYKFSRAGNYSVSATIEYYEDILDTSKKSKFTASVRVSVNLRPPGDPIIYQVTVVDAPNDEKVYAIDGQVQPFLDLMRNRKYVFDQSHPSNTGYPLRFFEGMMYDSNGNLIGDHPNHR